jgi:glycosyltransferase involved in cell wall biosynthesis
MVWRDGTTKGYGRGDDPDSPEYNFLREIDYSSGAFLLVKKELFLKLGKFNTMYRPGYYEEADFCMRLRKNGYKVIYQPFAQVIHYETVSMEDKVSALQTKNSALFSRIWGKEVLLRYPIGQELLARFSGKSRRQKNLLYIDNEAPDPKLGSGYPRTYAIMDCLLKLGYNVTFYPAISSSQKNETVEYFQKRGVEMFYETDNKKLDFEEFLKERKNYYEIIFVSRPDNMARFGDIIKKYSAASSLIYDAEAIFAVRELAYLEIIGEKISEAKKEEILKNEINLCKNADRIISVSERERNIFEKYGVKKSFVISHQGSLRLTPKKFEERIGLFFAGGILFDGPKNPNLDSILYFVKKVFPLVRKKVDCEFLIAGKDASGRLKNLKIKGVKWLGCVDDLSEYYNNSKIFIVPTRFCAGLPLKAIEAASYGLPIVASKITAEQLDWKDGKECLVGENPQDFAEKIIRLYSDAELWNKIKNNAAEKIKTEYSPKVFEESVRKAFSI